MEDHWNNMTEPCILRQLRTEEGREMRKIGIEEFKYRSFYPRQDGICNTITSVTKDCLVVEPITPPHKRIFLRYGFGHGQQGCSEDIAFTINSSSFENNNFIVEIPPPSIQRAAEQLKAIAQQGRQSVIGVTIHSNYDLRPYRADRADMPTASEFDTKYENNMSNTISTSHPGNVYGESTMYRIRKLTPRECFRLMGVGDKDIDKIQSHVIRTTLENGEVKEKPIPKSQQYKMAGNSIVVDCLYHIFRTLLIPNQPENKTVKIIQKSLFD